MVPPTSADIKVDGGPVAVATVEPRIIWAIGVASIVASYDSAVKVPMVAPATTIAIVHLID
jgi:hypothetical protein